MERSPAAVPSITAKIRSRGKEFTVIATHPLPPVSPSYFYLRNEQLEKLPDFINGAEDPVLLLGDLNCTPWCYHFQQLLERTGLKNSSRGWGLHATWPTALPLLLIPIDHCLYHPAITIVKKETGPFIGSDHYPVIVDSQSSAIQRDDAKQVSPVYI